MNRIRIERQIIHLQNILNTKYPIATLAPLIATEVNNEVSEASNILIETVDDPEVELTDLDPDEIIQRNNEERTLQEKLAKLELDKLIKKKPRQKKI
jgi:hypothetical protein